MAGELLNFSFRTRADALRKFREQTFDLLVIGGGITGAAVARDAAMRGLSVAVVDKQDFAAGTSSRSSKLIHGGLRYLENLEFGLVFEALKERSLLLKTVPNMVRPLPFYFPVHGGDRPGKWMLGTGMWLYDLLAMFRAPGFHKTLSKRDFLQAFPFLRSEGLKGGFRYFDASMWDDVLTVQVLRSAHEAGAVVANYVEAIAPQWKGDRIVGYRLRDLESDPGEGEIDIRAHQIAVCVGPWTDLLGQTLSRNWKKWLAPSRGVHLVFDLKRIPVP
ncbi:MAG TPA: glycerol-3-phosphate dehydrogenase/oxidase, partial [Bdellovibrionales bacterium]|nr:glycerol-3-phosphate dehydrogenase/oxidase [Bdellovibrionales bacterium]